MGKGCSGEGLWGGLGLELEVGLRGKMYFVQDYIKSITYKD